MGADYSFCLVETPWIIEGWAKKVGLPNRAGILQMMPPDNEIKDGAREKT